MLLEGSLSTQSRAQAGSYSLFEVIGEGGTARVHRAKHSLLEREAAVKVLHAGFVGVVDIERMFLHEARLMSSIQHPGLVEVFDLGRMFDGTLYCAMELVRGTTLAELLEHRHGALQDFLESCIDLAGALAEVHAAGYVHRDVKSENVVITNVEGRRTAKLVDFGTSIAIGHSQPSVLCGTPRAMAPEQIDGRDFDHRVDIWAFGVLLYELLTGRTPFVRPQADLEDILTRIETADPPPLPRVFPQKLRDLVDSCLAKRADDRPASMSTVVSELSELLAVQHSIQLEESLAELEAEMALESAMSASDGSEAFLVDLRDTDVLGRGPLRTAGGSSPLARGSDVDGRDIGSSIRLHFTEEPDWPLQTEAYDSRATATEVHRGEDDTSNAEMTDTELFLQPFEIVDS